MAIIAIVILISFCVCLLVMEWVSSYYTWQQIERILRLMDEDHEQRREMVFLLREIRNK